MGVGSKRRTSSSILHTIWSLVLCKRTSCEISLVASLQHYMRSTSVLADTRRVARLQLSTAFLVSRNVRYAVATTPTHCLKMLPLISLGVSRNFPLTTTRRSATSALHLDRIYTLQRSPRLPFYQRKIPRLIRFRDY